MHLRINNTDFEEISNLSFSPEADLINDSLPIPEFECRVYTNVNIQYGQWADLLDENNNLYAHYWIRFAERIGRDEDNDTYVVRLIAQSPLAFLERVTLPAEMLDDDAWVLIMDILDYLGAMGQDGDIISSEDIDDAVGDIHITGFCPEQSARERLQWILTAAGGYALSAFNDVIYINQVPFGNSPTKTIPIDKTFWKPSITYRDYVTKIKVTGYSFAERTPTNVDEYVTDGTSYWVLTKQVITLTNPSLPSGVPSNEIIVDGITLISPSRASVVATILANHYFNRTEIDADVINNAEYEPGDSVMVYTDEDSMYSGYIDHLDFKFGINSRSRVHLVGTTNVETAKLTVNYVYDNTTIRTEKYTLPKGTAYSVTTKYVDYSMNNHRYIFRPTTAEITGTLSSSTTVTVPCEVALDYYPSASNDLQIALETYEYVRSVLTSQYNNDADALMKKYRKNPSKLNKYMNKLTTNYDKNVRNAQEAIVEGVSDTERRLYIYSVDDFEIDTQVIEDSKTVVIS